MSDSRERIMDDVHGWALEKRDLSLYGNVAAFLRRLDNVRDEELRGLEEELEELSAALGVPTCPLGSDPEEFISALLGL